MLPEYFLAALFYTAYCAAVGGKAFNGDPLPPADEFFNDLTKEKQANGYREAVKAFNTPLAISELISKNEVPTDEISDGYHTFGELYEHRITIYLALCRIINENRTAPVWKSKKHSDGELAFGGTWFVLGINTEPGKQITYHLPIEAWDKCNFVEVDQAPPFDGHTPEDVLKRISEL